MHHNDASKWCSEGNLHQTSSRADLNWLFCSLSLSRIVTTIARPYMHQYSACAWHTPNMHMQVSSEGTIFGIIAASLQKPFLLFNFFHFLLFYFLLFYFLLFYFLLYFLLFCTCVPCKSLQLFMGTKSDNTWFTLQTISMGLYICTHFAHLIII